MKSPASPSAAKQRFELVNATKLAGSRLPVVADIARNSARILRDPCLRWGPNQSWSGRRT